MSAFINGFNIGFAGGMFNRMFGGFNPFCNFNPFCGCNFLGGFNFAPSFFTPMMSMSVFTPYTLPSFNMPLQNFTMPVMNNTFNSGTLNNARDAWSSLPMSDSFTSTTRTVSDSSVLSNSINTYASNRSKPSESANHTVSKSTSYSKSTNSSGFKTTSSSYIPTTAATYLDMSDAEMKRVYGNYTKNITQLYNGTADDLNKHLAKRGVLAGKGQAFIDAQKKYGISASVMAAICIQETGGTSSNARNKNNVANISKGKGWRTYNSIEACIDDMGRLLKENYVKKGLTALYQINAKYCPIQDTRGTVKSQSAWASKVDKISNTLEQA